MTRFAIHNARVVTDGGILDDHSVVVADGRIAEILPTSESSEAATAIDAEGRLLSPGFIDIQVNGGGGMLFNDNPSVEAIRAIGEAHQQYGTSGFLPTLISDDIDVIERAIQAVDTAIASDVPGVLGIHIEGPFLNRERRGVHDAAKIQPIDNTAVGVLGSLQRGVTMVTLAPEEVPPALLAELVDAGVIVAAGHSNGTYAEIRQALDCGLHGFTHLYNAMSPLLAREPGVVGAALEDVNSWCGLIVDGHHVHPAALNIAIASKAKGGCLLVTDAMPCVGTDDTEFFLQGQRIDVSDGRCQTADGTLAGSALEMASAVRNACSLLAVDRQEALRMASSYPAKALGLHEAMGRIHPGYRADLLLLDDNFEVIKTIVGGHIVFERST